MLRASKAGIPRCRQGHQHRRGHPRRLTREDVGVSGDFPVQLAIHSRSIFAGHYNILSVYVCIRAEHARGSSPTCPTRTIFLARIRMSVRDASVYTCTAHDKLSCTHSQNYTIGVSLMTVSVTVSVPWNSSLSRDLCRSHRHVQAY